MKFALIVLTEGKWQGKEINITVPEFLIGRDPQCQLRPSNALISKRHCALITRAGQVFVRDFESTNGTFVNAAKVNGELELKNGDRLRVGPLEFRVALETSVPVDRRTPLPTNKLPAASPEEEAAQLLLSLQETDTSAASDQTIAVDKDGIPTGSTIHEAVQAQSTGEIPNAAAAKNEEDAKKEKTKMEAAKKAAADTSSAASAILTKYLRRPR
jgi:pSer/pThr/pTyr-binding forkhead associated (FHA) protein